MTISRQPDPAAAPEVVVRDYADGDYRACRSLWAELTEYHRGIYGDPSIGGDDPGAGFVVAESARHHGVGRLLIGRAVEESRGLGYEYLAIRPVARNVAAIRRFHAAGFTALGGHVDLTMDLAPQRHGWLSGAGLHGLDFGY
jgi:GNAT superfamily N-acetyltransferase